MSAAAKRTTPAGLWRLLVQIWIARLLLRLGRGGRMMLLYRLLAAACLTGWIVTLTLAGAYFLRLLFVG